MPSRLASACVDVVAVNIFFFEPAICEFEVGICMPHAFPTWRTEIFTKRNALFDVMKHFFSVSGSWVRLAVHVRLDIFFRGIKFGFQSAESCTLVE